MMETSTLSTTNFTTTRSSTFITTATSTIHIPNKSTSNTITIRSPSTDRSNTPTNKVLGSRHLTWTPILMEQAALRNVPQRVFWSNVPSHRVLSGALW